MGRRSERVDAFDRKSNEEGFVVILLLVTIGIIFSVFSATQLRASYQTLKNHKISRSEKRVFKSLVVELGMVLSDATGCRLNFATKSVGPNQPLEVPSISYPNPGGGQLGSVLAQQGKAYEKVTIKEIELHHRSNGLSNTALAELRIVGTGIDGGTSFSHHFEVFVPMYLILDGGGKIERCFSTATSDGSVRRSNQPLQTMEAAICAKAGTGMQFNARRMACETI